MTIQTSEPRLRHDPGAAHFELLAGAEVATLQYHLDRGRMVITHTFVPPTLRGGGVAAQLVRAALAEAREQGWKVRSECSYVTVFLQRYREEFADLTG